MRSSFFSTEVTKLVSIYLRDIRINKDIQNIDNFTQSPELGSYRGVGAEVPQNGTNSGANIPDFRQAKVPPSILKFAQFMAVHVNDISMVLLYADFDPNWFIHITVKTLHLDGSIVQNAKKLFVNAVLTESQVIIKILMEEYLIIL